MTRVLNFGQQRIEDLGDLCEFCGGSLPCTYHRCFEYYRPMHERSLVTRALEDAIDRMDRL